MCGVSTGAVASEISVCTPACLARTVYVAYQPVRAGGFSVVRNPRYRPPAARRSLATGMFVRTADSPCTATVPGSVARAVRPSSAGIVPSSAVIVPRSAGIVVRLLKSMPPADTHGPSLRVTRKSVRSRKGIGVAP